MKSSPMCRPASLHRLSCKAHSRFLICEAAQHALNLACNVRRVPSADVYSDGRRERRAGRGARRLVVHLSRALPDRASARVPRNDRFASGFCNKPKMRTAEYTASGVCRYFRRGWTGVEATDTGDTFGSCTSGTVMSGAFEPPLKNAIRAPSAPFSAAHAPLTILLKPSNFYTRAQFML